MQQVTLSQQLNKFREDQSLKREIDNPFASIDNYRGEFARVADEAQAREQRLPPSLPERAESEASKQSERAFSASKQGSRPGEHATAQQREAREAEFNYDQQPPIFGNTQDRKIQQLIAGDDDFDDIRRDEAPRERAALDVDGEYFDEEELKRIERIMKQK